MSAAVAHVERVLAAVSSSAAARSRLAASWQRSFHKYGLDPARSRRLATPDHDRLRDRREDLGALLAVAAGRLDDLHAMVGHCGCGILLTDAEGLVIDSRVSSANAGTFGAWGLAPGSDWSEAAQGTNGIGTCLAERRAVTIHRDQHFLSRNTAMSCIDAPVFGAEGALVAALDVSSARVDQTEGFNRLIEAMVTRVARQIESDLFRAAFPRHRILLGNGDEPGGAALLAVDADGLVVGATREARRQHGMAVEGALRPRPLVDLIGRDSGPAGLDRAERAEVICALARAGGNVSEAARSLGLGRATLYRRMKRLGIDEHRPAVEVQ